jgi:hypothetical protein
MPVDDPTLNQLSPDAIHRPVDWRWRLAGLPDEQFRSHAASADEWVIRARKWRQTKLVTEKVPVPRRAVADDPTLSAAVSLHFEASELSREIVEAALLTREPMFLLAIFTGVPGEVVEAYEKLFFSVIDRLDSAKWIESTAIGPDRATRGNIWKTLAFHGGLSDLRVVIPLSLDQPLPPSLLDRNGVTAATMDKWFRTKYRLLIPFAAAPPERKKEFALLYSEWSQNNPMPGKEKDFYQKVFEAVKVSITSKHPNSAKTEDGHLRVPSTRKSVAKMHRALYAQTLKKLAKKRG